MTSLVCSTPKERMIICPGCRQIMKRFQMLFEFSWGFFLMLLFLIYPFQFFQLLFLQRLLRNPL